MNKNSFIPVNRPLLNGNEKKYLNECIDTGWISSDGPFVGKFEKEFSKLVDRKYGAAVCIGTAALELAFSAIEMMPGDEIIMPTNTIISCALPIVRGGGVPIVVDCDRKTFNIDYSQIEAKITAKTKAIMAVHIFGLPVEMDKIISLCEKYNLYLIEDAAEMHGQFYNNKPCGSFGHLSIFSFYANKHITTGEGGMVVSDDKEIINKINYYKNLCFNQEQRFSHDHMGWNFRMSNLQAAVGLAQIEQMKNFKTLKRNLGKKYTELLSDIPEIVLPLISTEYAENNFWVYPIILGPKIKCDAKTFISELNSKKIGSRPFFWPIHKQPVFLKMGLFKNECHPNAEYLVNRGLYLPSGMGTTEDEILRVSNAVKNIVTKYK